MQPIAAVTLALRQNILYRNPFPHPLRSKHAPLMSFRFFTALKQLKLEQKNSPHNLFMAQNMKRLVQLVSPPPPLLSLMQCEAAESAPL